MPSNAAYFSHPDIVLEYTRAAVSVGLWESERLLCERFFLKDAPLLELGCGAGRVAFGLWREGWQDITATDFSPPMVEAAQAINDAQHADIRFAVADATALPFASGTFASVFFGFNGLMMIPGAAWREAALREMCRVLRPGGVAIFTGHERGTPANAAYWNAERVRWDAGTAPADLEFFGDSYNPTPAGKMYIHAATPTETAALVARCGFAVELSAMRSEIANESASVRDFSDDTRFWVVRKGRQITNYELRITN